MTSRVPIVLLALMLVASIPTLFADGTTINAGWGENVEARVLDAHDRPIPGASVNVTWPLTGVKWATTKNKITDERGRAYFSIDTYEFIKEKVVYDFYVNASYDGKQAQEKYDHNISLGSPRTVWLPVYRVTFKTTDHAGKPMSVDVVLNGTLRVRTDNDGWGQLPVAKGTHDVSIWFGKNEQKTTLTVNEDMNASLILMLYSLTLQVMDDRGMPLAAEVGAGSELLRTDSMGEVRFENKTESTLLVTAYYGNLKKEATVDLTLFNRTLMVFDVHPPTIGEPTSIYNGSMLIVRIPIVDNGDYSSGLGERRASVVMQYTLPGQTKPKTTQMYTVGYNLFEGAIPIAGNVGDVRYTVIATDADGNTAQSTDVYTIRIDPAKTKPETQIKPNEAPPDFLSQYGWLLVLLAMGAVGGGYWFYISRNPPSGRTAGTPYKYDAERPRTGGMHMPSLGKSIPKKTEEKPKGE